MKPGMKFRELAQLQKEQLSSQPPLSYEEMKVSVERVQVGSLQSVKERIENTTAHPDTRIEELMKEQVEITRAFPMVTTGIPVILVENEIPGNWYEVVQPNQQESTIFLKQPFYFECHPHWGIGMLVIKLGEQILGVDETLLLRYENRGMEGCADIQFATSKKLLEFGYDSVVFYEKEPLHLREVYVIPDGRL